MKRMFKWTALLLIMLSANMLQADIGFRTSLVRPTGYLGYLVKPAIGFQLHFTDDFEDDWRIRGGFNYINFNQRLDTFPVYGQEYSNGTWKVYPGYQTFTLTRMANIVMGVDYGFLNYDALTFYGGMDVNVGGFDMIYESEIPGFSSRSATETAYFMGLTGRVGADYQVMESIGVYAEVNRTYNRFIQIGWRTMNEYSIGIRASLFN